MNHVDLGISFETGNRRSCQDTDGYPRKDIENHPINSTEKKMINMISGQYHGLANW